MELNIYAGGDELPLPIYYQVQGFSRVVWWDGDGYNIDLGLEEPAIHVVLADGKLLISYAAIIWRDIQHDGIMYKCYGLSGVLTFPAFRRRGFGGRVVQAATDYIRNEQMAEIALLWTDPVNENFYTRCGWQAMPSMTTLVGNPDRPQVYDEELPMMLFISERAKAKSGSFESAHLYVGEEQW